VGLVEPLGDLIFNFLEKGKLGFKEFGDAVISTIKRIVAQMLASKIIQLLGSLVAPGGGAAASGIFNAFSGFGGGIKMPSFGGGAGLSGGAMNLSGGIKFIVRGPDLVAAMTNANAQIGRIG
jgi:lambda family phage tail tape measure protein